MTSAQFTVGLTEDSRNTSKVLKPPGGGSSNIFGQSEETIKQTSNKKYYGASHFTLGNQAEEAVESSVGTNGKSMTASLEAADNASVSSQEAASSTSNDTPDNSEPNTPRSGTPLLSGPIANDKNQPAKVPTPSRPQGRRCQGNPVTGEGYEKVEKKEETPVKQRVPPGGFSSKLW